MFMQTEEFALDRSIKREPSEHDVSVCSSTWYGSPYRRISLGRSEVFDNSLTHGKGKNNFVKTRISWLSRSILVVFLGILLGLGVGLHRWKQSQIIDIREDCSADDVDCFRSQSKLQEDVEELKQKVSKLYFAQSDDDADSVRSRSELQNDVEELKRTISNLSSVQEKLRSEIETRKDREKQWETLAEILRNNCTVTTTTSHHAIVPVSINESTIISLDDRLRQVEGAVNDLVKEKSDSSKILMNYADSQYGATVIPAMTSPTLFPRSKYPILDFFLKMETYAHPITDRGVPRLGDCWCFNKSKGTYTVKLVTPAKIEHVVYNHAPWGNVDRAPLSAPRKYEIWGCYDDLPRDPLDDDHCIQLGDCTYGVNKTDISGCTIQNSFSVPIVQMRISSNHGGDYTCLYSMKIEGSHKCGENAMNCPFSTPDMEPEGASDLKSEQVSDIELDPIGISLSDEI